MTHKLIYILLTLFPMQPVSAQKVIDTHTHCISETYVDYLRSHDALLEEDFPIPHWDLESHLTFMEEADISLSVLSLPAPQPWFGDSQESARLVRTLNEEMAAIKAANPGKFLFSATLPLPDVDKAIEEAIYALDVLKADGIKIASNSRGLYLGDPQLEPLMKVLDERNAVIITHPHKPSAVNPTLTSVVPLASYEYLAETTRAILNMIGHNVMIRYPRLKIVVPHCGSLLPLSIPRMSSLMPVMNSVGYLQGIDINGNLASLYYDLAGAATPETIKELLTITTKDHLIYGTDYPYASPAVLKQNLERLRLTLGDILPGSVEQVLYQNAIELFR